MRAPDRRAMWYQNAIIYGIDVARFADSDGDGIGDFPGLTARLGYLVELGVTCIWLLPFFPSDWRDNGYDITDYFSVDPRLGTLDDFLEFMHRADERGIRVILDAVANHTSDHHPWFQAARRDEASRYRDYYIWSHDPPPLPPGEETMFPGNENTVWTYDEVARASYYHRFYDFEPGLNPNSEEVRQEVLRMLDLWLSFGAAGFRLDAANHMIGQKALARTAVPDPHDILRRYFTFVRERRPDAAMLAEVDLPPEGIADFFEGGDQINLMYNFQLNNHLFLAFAREEATPIMNALRIIPPPPEQGRWANFLRNLDEVDLEQLDPDERQEVLDAFAPKDGMRLFGRGARRRLAPMFDGDTRRLAMAFSLLFSLPGVPLMVYGDEIGMGEDLSQPGRSAVRMPMQWSGGRNGGFSEAAAGDLIQPAQKGGPFGYGRVNVEAQRADPSSLLTAVRGLIQARRRHPEMGRAAWLPVSTGNPRVFAHSHNISGRLMLHLHNLSREPQEVRLDLDGTDPGRLDDIFGMSEPLDDLSAPIALEPYGYRWLRSEPC